MLSWFKDVLWLICNAQKIRTRLDAQEEALLSLSKSVRQDFCGLQSAIRTNANAIANAQKVLRAHTTVSADLNVGRGENMVVLVGRWKNNDYVEILPMPSDAFPDIVEHMRHLAKTYSVHRIDAPQHMRAAFLRDTF